MGSLCGGEADKQSGVVETSQIDTSIKPRQPVSNISREGSKDAPPAEKPVVKPVEKPVEEPVDKPVNEIPIDDGDSSGSDDAPVLA